MARTPSRTRTGAALLTLGAVVALATSAPAQAEPDRAAPPTPTTTVGASGIARSTDTATISRQQLPGATPSGAAHSARTSPAATGADTGAGTAKAAASGTYQTVSPTRILDTRYGIGAPKAKLGQKRTLTLTVAGRGGIPLTAASSVVFNLTAVNASSRTFLTAYPGGTSRPTASNLNLTAGATRANLVTLPLNGGKVTIYNDAGSLDVIADVVGWYAGTGAGGTGTSLYPTDPQRLFDSRQDPAPFQSQEVHCYSFAYTPGSTDSLVRALAINLTAVSPSKHGSISVWSGTGDVPLVSSLNFAAGETAANMAVVPVTHSGGRYGFGVKNSAYGTVDILADVVGVYVADGQGLYFEPMAPRRIVDTRYALGMPGSIGPQGTRSATTSGVANPQTTYLLAGNITVVAPTARTYLIVWPTGDARPDTSNLNAAAGTTVANSIYVPVGAPPSGSFSVFNAAGTTPVIVDVSGKFVVRG